MKPWFRVFSFGGMPYFFFPIHWKGVGLILALMIGWLIWGSICAICFGMGILPKSVLPAVLFLPFIVTDVLFMRAVMAHSEAG